MAFARPRGRIRELLAIALGHEPNLKRHFMEALRDEVVQADWCAVCHRALDGYEDGRCVGCHNNSICIHCLQIPQPGCSITILQWEPLSQEHTLRTVRTTGNELICLQCDLYTTDATQVEKERIFHVSSRTNDALLCRDKKYGLLTLAFLGIALASKIPCRDSYTCQCLAQFMMYAEEVRFFELAKAYTLLRLRHS